MGQEYIRRDRFFFRTLVNVSSRADSHQNSRIALPVHAPHLPSLMSSSSLVLIPLSDSDKEIIRLSLQNEDMKIYTVASVSLLFMDKTKDVTATNLLGTLVLFRTGPRLVLRLLDISVSPSITKWQHDLTSGAAIVETEQDGEKRTYALTDTVSTLTLHRTLGKRHQTLSLCRSSTSSVYSPTMGRHQNLSANFCEQSIRSRKRLHPCFNPREIRLDFISMN